MLKQGVSDPLVRDGQVALGPRVFSVGLGQAFADRQVLLVLLQRFLPLSLLKQHVADVSERDGQVALGPRVFLSRRGDIIAALTLTALAALDLLWLADSILDTFAPGAVMTYNGRPFPDRESIAWAHGYIGMSAAAGAFRGLRNEIDRESFTDREIVIEGRLRAAHEGEFLGFAPSGEEVELPFIAFYDFGDDGKLLSERVVMNLGPLHRPDGQAR